MGISNSKYSLKMVDKSRIPVSGIANNGSVAFCGG
jgi:hypothetical protein